AHRVGSLQQSVAAPVVDIRKLREALAHDGVVVSDNPADAADRRGIEPVLDLTPHRCGQPDWQRIEVPNDAPDTLDGSGNYGTAEHANHRMLSNRRNGRIESETLSE